MNCFHYKNYVGSVEVSVEDRCLFGKLEFIRDLVTYEGTTLDELENEFKNAVDDYISTCSAAGKEPEKPFSGTFNVRVGPDLHRELAVASKGLGLTLNDFVKQTLQERVGKEPKQVVHVHRHEVVFHHEQSFDFSSRSHRFVIEGERWSTLRPQRFNQ
jgi:predicted HicB family RNase H-like nuclease